MTSVSELVPQVNGFVIDKRLGSGTYACVYKALPKNSNSDGQPVAIKCIKKSSLNKVSTENLLREIKILKYIKHEYIVQLKDFQWDDNFIYLIMEYCAGGDLSQFIKSRRTVPEKYVRRFVQQIACALKHLHQKGIAHMDLKPQNILLTSVTNPSLKLADFGFAQYMRGENVSRSLRGSPLYMAPEILRNKIYDSKVDLWSVGVILHEVIFGYAPFVSNSLEELEQKIMDDSPIEIPNHIMLSETCKDLLKRLLKRNPNDRISFFEFFTHPFVDLEHMASPESLPRANDLLSKAVRFDKTGDYLLAQKYYLQSIEYLIPAIQYEKDSKKKQEIREKANKYLKRAEEIADYNNPARTNPPINQAIMVPKTISVRQRTDTFENDRTPSPMTPSPNASAFRGDSTLIPVTFETSIRPGSSSSISSSVSVANFSPIELLKTTENNPNVYNAIRSCLNADERIKMPNSDNRDLLDQYQEAISLLLPFVKELPKDDFSRSLRYHISRWLSNAEKLKAEEQAQNKPEDQSKQNLELLNARDRIKEDDEDNSQYYKACLIS